MEEFACLLRPFMFNKGVSDSICIRRAQLSDAHLLASFNTALARETENKELKLETILCGVSRLLSDPQFGFYLVAEVAGEVAGCLMITYEWSDWRNGVFWWIQSVYVKPEFRRQGIYRSLHAYVRDAARADANVCGLRLYAETQNEKAQRAYEKAGMHLAPYKMFEESFSAL